MREGDDGHREQEVWGGAKRLVLLIEFQLTLYVVGILNFICRVSGSQ